MSVMKPLWITIDGHFEGHQGHFADCFFSNACILNIIDALQTGEFAGATWSIRPMTDDELAEHPDADQYAGWYTNEDQPF